MRRVFIFGIFISQLEIIFSFFFVFLFFEISRASFLETDTAISFLRKGWEVMFSVFLFAETSAFLSKMKKQFFLCKVKPNKTKLQIESFIANQFGLHKVFLSFFWQNKNHCEKLQKTTFCFYPQKNQILFFCRT